jgi:hypothetical protein
MSNTIRTILSVTNLVSGLQAYGTIPQSTEDVVTYSNKLHQTVQVVGTTHELLSAGDVPDDAMAIVKNLSSTATIQIGVEVAATFYPLLDIPPGETSKLSRLSTIASTYIKSDTASTQVLVSLYEIDPTA